MTPSHVARSYGKFNPYDLPYTKEWMHIVLCEPRYRLVRFGKNNNAFVGVGTEFVHMICTQLYTAVATVV